MDLENKKEKNIKIWAEKMKNYKLLDSGEREKLEEINGKKIVRAEPRAWWKKSLEKVIDIGIGGIKAKIKFKNTSKHIGIFPEQFEQWKFISEKIKNYNLNRKDNPSSPPPLGGGDQLCPRQIIVCG